MASAMKKIAAPASRGARLMSSSASAGEHAEKHAKMWANLSNFVALPAVAICSYITYQNEKHHDEPPPEFREYDHMRIRRKKFPWGDGNHSLFHNPKTNPLPGIGYEEPWVPKNPKH